MKFFVTSGGRDGSTGFGSGGPDASRAMLVRQLVPTLEHLGQVICLDTPAKGIRRAAGRTDAVHLCFALPDELPDAAGVETIPVFGLSFAACPSSPAGDSTKDWRACLQRCGAAICLSSHAADAVRALMGAAYPVLVVPPPVACADQAVPPSATTLRVDGMVLDTAVWTETGPPAAAPPSDEDEDDAGWPDLAPEGQVQAWQKTARYRLGVTRLHLAHAYRDAWRDLLPTPVARLVSHAGRRSTLAARRLLALRQARKATGLPGDPALSDTETADDDFVAWQEGPRAVDLDRLVFAAVQGAWDRSWGDVLSGFVLTCRDDPDATLVIKTAQLGQETRAGLAAYIRRLGPFACRVVILDGTIEGGLDSLVSATWFYLCASHSEASPLPMMRFMAAGRPAVSPDHSALADFVSPQTGFVVASGIEYETWPNDPDERLNATGWRLDWESLCHGIDAACAAAHRATDYAALAQGAAARMRAFCGPEAVLAELRKLASLRP